MDERTRRWIVALYLLAIIGSSAFSSQLIADRLGYQPQLDWCIYDGGSFKLYMPFAWLAWYFRWKGPGTEWFFNRYGFSPFAITMCACGLMILVSRLFVEPGLTDNHGSAHFATLKEIEGTKDVDPPGLLSGKGVILGVLPDGRLIRDDTKTHVLVCAPTRSGKGVGIIIPTLVTWPHSVVVTDIKGENWALTSGWRKDKMGCKVLKFEPTSEFSSHYNPFDEVRIRTKYEVRDIQNIVKILVDPTGQGSEGPSAHWINNSAALLTGVVLHLKYIDEHANMYDVLSFLYADRDFERKEEEPVSPDAEESEGSEEEEAFGGFGDLDKKEGLQGKMQELLQMGGGAGFPHDPSGTLFADIYGDKMGGVMHPLVKQYFQSMVDKPDKEFGSILSTLDTVLNTYRDPIIAENMKESHFRMTDLMTCDEPVSLYLVFPPSDIDRVKPVFRVIVEMLYRRNTEPMEFKDGVKVEAKHRMLMLLDEFPALGKLETFEKAMAYIAGYGIKAMIITQDVNQIEKLYTVSNSIISNCQVQVYHTPTDNKTPEFISKKMGNKTVRTRSTSVSGGLLNLGGRSSSLNEAARPLMTPDEVNTMDKKKELIFLAGVSPILCDKIRFYEEPFFSVRTKRPAPVKTDVIARPPETARPAPEKRADEPQPDFAAVAQTSRIPQAIAFADGDPALESVNEEG